MNDVNLTIFNEEKPHTRASIQELEAAVLALPQIEFHPKHYFGGGIYARELFMPKGACVTGQIHINEHICTIAYGDVTVADEDGTTRYTGYNTFTGKAGTKRALVMHEDTLWIAYHVTDKTTVEDAMAEIVTNDYKVFDRIAGEKKCLCL